METRRDLLRLVLFGTPVLLTRCMESTQAIPVEVSDGRMHARVDPSAPHRPLVSTNQPQRLGLGTPRDGFFYVPASARKFTRAPLIVYLHGATGTGERAIQRLLPHADATGAIVVAPDSRDETWGVVTGNEGPDLDFLDTALEKMFRSYAIDPARIALAGFSDGASAALSLGLVNGDLFSAIVAFSPGFMNLSSPPKGMPRVFLSHGISDSVLPIERCGRRIALELRSSGYKLDYREFDGDHTVPDDIRAAGFRWVM